MGVVNIIIWTNAAVFLSWMTLDTPFMMEHFLVSASAVQAGRPWTLFTSVFSHAQLLHLFLNMFVLREFGRQLEALMGGWRFIVFYLAAGLSGSLIHCLTSTWFMGDPSIPALGASGAVSGVLTFFSLLFPTRLLLLFGLIPVPAIMAAVLFVGIDLWGLLAQAQGGGLPIGHGAHLGGALMGLLWYLAARLRHRS